MVINELKWMQALDHPNVLKIKGSGDGMVKDESGMEVKCDFMALEACLGGELFDYIAETGKFSARVSRFYFKQLLSALTHMHEKGISHRDVKPENIMFDSEFTLKLIDFGFATDQTKTNKKLGTLGYMAPEIILEKPYCAWASDLFAAAIVLFIMHTGSPPF